jgi:hypothetical protein
MQDATAPYRVIPIVAPVSNDPNTSGKIRNLHVGGGVQHQQLVTVTDPRTGRILGHEINPAYHRAGWRKLEDLYAEEHNPEGWAKYARYLDAWRAGRTRSPFPAADLPRAVVERQRATVPDEFADDFRAKPVTGAVVEGKPADEPAKPSKRNPAPEARS